MIPTIHDGRTIIFEEEGVLGSFKKQTHKAKPAVKKKIVQGPLRKKIQRGLSVNQVLCLTLKKVFLKLLPAKKKK